MDRLSVREFERRIQRSVDPVLDVEQQRMLDDITTAARLDLSRGTDGDPLPPLRKKRLSGQELVDAAHARFQKRLPERRLVCHVASSAPEVDADPNLLRRALDNLLDNAAKFSDPDTAIVRAFMGLPMEA